MKFTIARTVFMAAFLLGVMGDAQAQSLPGSASELLGLSGLSGENQGAAMDGGRTTSDDSAMGASSGDVCFVYSSYAGNEYFACRNGITGGSCQIYSDLSEYAACRAGRSEYEQNNPNDTDSGGGGSLDPLFGLLAVSYVIWMGKRERIR